jgi:MtN3 and saliva related transmembrane protein
MRRKIMDGNIITIIGSLAGICTTVSTIPQAIKTMKMKETKDLSLWMYIILNIGVIFWFVYGIGIKEWPIIIANGVTLIFTSIILGYKIKYK